MNIDESLLELRFEQFVPSHFYTLGQAALTGNASYEPSIYTPIHVAQVSSTWIYKLSHIAQTGYVQLAVTVLSILLTTIAVVRITSQPHRQSPAYDGQFDKGSGIRLFYELCSQAFRGVAAAFLIIAAQRGRMHWANAAAVSYAFVLGLLRLGGKMEWRHVSLHQVNFVLSASLVLVCLGQWLPCVEDEVACRFRNELGAATVALVAAVLVAFATPREWMPPSVDEYDVPENRRQRFAERGPAPEETCSWLEFYCTYEWLTPTIWRGARNDLPKEQLPNVPWYDDPMVMLARVRKARAWGKSTMWTAVHLVWAELALMSLWISASYIFEILGPLGMYKLLGHIEKPDESSTRPWVWLMALFLGPTLRSLCFQQYVFISTRLIIRVKAAFTQELYHMAVNSMELEHEETKLDDKTNKKQSITTAGRLANLMASDIESIFKARDTVMVVIGIPIGTIAGLVFLYNVIGWPSLVGTFFLLLTSPCNVLFGRFLMKIQHKARKAQDFRISVATEYLSQIRAVKYFAWEDAATSKIEEARLAELKQIWIATLYNCVNAFITQILPYVALFSIFILAIFVDDRTLTGSVAFTTVSLVKNIRNKLSRVGWLSRFIAMAMVAFGRVDSYFESARPVERYPAGPPCIRNATFRKTVKTTFQLKDINIDFVQGGLTAVTGPSGAGKTTLLLSLLGETIKESGEVTRPTDVAFASQTSWLQNGTLKENVLFTDPFNPERYNRVIAACCLNQDISELADGDESVIGENGASLSGGQRARVALARALYSTSPMLLLDDIFSALDAKTAAHLWELCFCSDLLQGRTTVLVTQIPWIGSQADFVVELENGAVKNTEQHLGVVRRPISIAKILMAGDHEEDAEGNKQVDDAAAANDAPTTTPAPTLAKAKLVDEIDAEMGGRLATRLSMFRYMRYFGSPVRIFAPIAGMFFVTAVTTAGNLWLAFWTKAYNDERIVNVGFYLGVYAALAVAECVSDIGQYLLTRLGGWYAARTLHDDLVRGVLRVSLSWYQDVPIGRVINRLSRDVSSVDGMLDILVTYTISLVFQLLFKIGSVSSIMPVFALPAAVMSVVGIVIGEMYTRTGVILRRLEASSQSPVFTQFTDTLAGLPVIRARTDMPAKFGDILADRLLLWAASAEALYNANRWVGVRIDFVTSLVSLGAGIIALAKSDTIDPGLVGFSLISANGLSGTILSLVRNMNMMEVELQSFDRIQEYAALDSEDKNDKNYPDEGEYTDDPSHVIPHNWPAKGEIEFRNVTIRYTLDGQDILSDINIKIRAGERVAVVGRTGSGKSTLVLSLLRFTNIVSGTILLDGVDITKVPRKRLRQALTIIPQEAILFSGTVEANMDPTGEVPRESLRKVLESTRGIASFEHHAEGDGDGDVVNADASEESSATAVENGGGGGGSTGHDAAKGLELSTAVAAKGENFSHGQRQVLSLCRALVRKSKLMLLDEATASMDYETDRKIQEALRRELDEAGGDRTLVTIAHRLRTIIDYDTVVVMSNGRMVEVGPPIELYKQNGIFYDMVQHSGEGDELLQILDNTKDVLDSASDATR